jgi:transcriptional regulator with XRE-family HTH domain
VNPLDHPLDSRDRLKALGETIKQLRLERGQGPRGLAFDAEIGEDTLTSLEEGKAEPRWGTLRRISRGLDLELSVILRKAEELEAEMERRP